MGEVGLAIGGLRMSIVTDDSRLIRIIKERYRGFQCPSASDWRIEVGIRGEGPFPEAGDVAVKRNGGPERYTIERYDFVGSVDLRKRAGQVTFAEPDEARFDSFLRIASSLWLVEANGLLIHASSMVRKGNGHLFCGPSGSGKSTVARISSDATILSDELSIVRIQESGAICYGTPFWGELAQGGQDLSEPLAGIYFLSKSTRNEVDSLNTKGALRRLLPNVVFFAKEREMVGRVVETAARLVKSVPCFDLSFRPDPGFWEVIDHA